MRAPSPASVAKRVLGVFDVGRMLRWRATVPGMRERPFLLWNGEAFTYADVYREARRYRELFDRTRQELVRQRALDADAPLPVGLYQDNTPAFVFAVFGAALSGDLAFGLNTGFRGDTLGAVLDRGEVRVVITDPEHVQHLDGVVDGRPTLERDRIWVDAASAPAGMRTLASALAHGGSAGTRRRVHGADPLLVIYTSGTTGVPKGIACSHVKLLGAGALTWRRVGVRPSDRGYVCMPLFHSNAWLLGVMPMLFVGGSFVLTPRFSASAFEDHILEHGVTYMNYVGQPIHYILAALEKRHGSPEAVEAALASHPKNRFRIAHGNGATAVDRQKLVRYLGMEHVYELYGSTEAVINTVVKPGAPIDSVGEITAKRVTILNEGDQQCPPAEVDESGRIVNYDQAVGEICASVPKENLLFDGYYRDPNSSNKKYRDGYYRSGDLGHVRVVNGKRYLYFDGRTDDWIRKDGENFSAETVALFAQQHPGVSIAAAYGVPAPVSDELVCVALQLHEGARFDPQATFDRFMEQQRDEGMDPKWMPDFVRVVEELPMSTTQKVLVRELKRQHFDLSRHPDMVLFFRERGDATYRPFGVQDYETLRARFADNGRVHLLDAGAAARPVLAQQ
jgi:fatty-acyl-CoA synthase